MIDDGLIFSDKDALLYRLHEGLEQSDKDVVFVVGAPLTAPVAGNAGVADVNAVTELIRAEFAGKSAQAKLDAELATSANRYQTAFDFLAPRAGQDAANRIVKRAVAAALAGATSVPNADITKLNEEQLTSFDRDPSAWHLSPGVAALGMLIARRPDRFGKLVITSNFDPLLEAAIGKGGGAAWRTSLSKDGSIMQSAADGCHVIHIHGYWHGTDTLHTNRQLIMSRPTLQNDLLALLQNKIVVVVAYGGWPDIFTNALSGVVSNDNLFPEVLWTFYNDQPQISDHLLATLRPGIDRSRVTFYAGIDCHQFFPELLDLWKRDGEEQAQVAGPVSPAAAAPVARDKRRLFKLAPLECDRPPNIDVWVGRDNELRALEVSPARVVILCGMGGEGKSVLAAHYIASLGHGEMAFTRWDWRDCKEQNDRVRTQIVEIIVRFSAGSISAEDLAGAQDMELVEVLLDQISDAHAVLVFDNVDSYIDLENRTFIGILDQLVQRMSAAVSTSRILLTCRPDVQYLPSSVITISMQGLVVEEAIELFAKRSPSSAFPEEDVRYAHSLTKGHAFWLDLIAVQVTKVPGTTLRKLLDDMRRGREDVPDVLSSIWDSLPEREQLLLRFMAETVRPETEQTIERFVASQLNYNKFSRALRSLISLHLIVVKPETNAPDLYDLHPLVRQFVRTKFAKRERDNFIRIVIMQYDRIIGAIESFLGIHLPFPMLERWSQKAELQVSAGLFEEAFETLEKVEDAFIGGGHIEEYLRVGRLLFEAIDWETAATRYKEFDKIVGVMVAAFDQTGDSDAADTFVQRYETTIPQKTARYIHLCDIRAYSCWQRGEFGNAIEWASKGVALKEETNVDTSFDCKHTLALARRDAGQPEAALQYFLRGQELTAIVTAPHGDQGDGPMLGNVGRCLQFMGQLDDALICYKKSITVLEKDASSHSKSNRAYARQWIGEILVTQNEKEKAEAFLMDAIRILGAAAPIRVRKLYDAVERLRTTSLVMSEERATRIVATWLRA